MTDKELLELAAKAAGIEFVPATNESGKKCEAAFGLWIKTIAEPYEGQRRRFNPLTDDGDALRLAVKLNIDVDHNAPGDEQLWVVSGRRRTCPVVLEEFEGEATRLAATRRAIVRAAAEIGRAMP